MKQKTHSFIIKVRFDKKCTKMIALREVRDCIHGEFYPSALFDGEPEQMKIKGFRHPPRKPSR